MKALACLLRPSIHTCPRTTHTNTHMRAQYSTHPYVHIMTKANLTLQKYFSRNTITSRLLNRRLEVHIYVTRPQSIKWYRVPLQWRNDEREDVSNHRRLDCLLNRYSGNTSKLRVTGLCEGNSPVTGEIPSQRGSNAENVSTWWRHQTFVSCKCFFERA